MSNYEQTKWGEVNGGTFPKSPLYNQVQKMIAEIAKDKVELRQWRYAASQVSASVAGTDVSTPQKFLTAQVNSVAGLLNEQDSLRKQLAQARQIVSDVLSRSFACSSVEDCARGQFFFKNKHIPVNHPVFNSAPLCNCWRGRAANFLKATISPSPGDRPAEGQNGAVSKVPQLGAPRRSDYRHASYCSPDSVEGCTCWVRTMHLNAGCIDEKL